MSLEVIDPVTSHGIVPAGPLLSVRNLETGFRTARGLVRAVDGVSFDLSRGQTLGVVGESGSGKTVLSRSVMRMLPRSNLVSAGSVFFEGRDLVGLLPKQLQSVWGAEIGLVSQDPMTALNPVVKIGRQITESIRHHVGVGKADARGMGISLLKSVAMPEPEKRMDVYPHELSGGLRQRVTIAMALACGPKLLIADEPTTALDVTVQAQILDLLGHQQRERNMAMILITHDLGVVAGRCDQIVVMYAGKVVEAAPTRVLFSEVKMRYTEALMASIPTLRTPSQTRLQAIEGRPPDLVDPPEGCRFAPRCRYADEHCHSEEPPLMPAESPGHFFACWHPVGGMPPPPEHEVARYMAMPGSAQQVPIPATRNSPDGR